VRVNEVSEEIEVVVELALRFRNLFQHHGPVDGTSQMILDAHEGRPPPSPNNDGDDPGAANRKRFGEPNLMPAGF
jgi:hypothetical protein